MLVSQWKNSLADSSTVAIDIGHSKQNPGAISARGKPEFEFNLDLGLALQDALTDHQIHSFLIGDQGDIEDVKQRSSIAETHDAKFFVSLHHDSAQPKYFKTWKWQETDRRYSDNFFGFSIFVSRKNPKIEKSLHCAQSIGQALKQKGFTKSSHHAEPLLGENREWADEANGIYFYDDLVVLKTANMPAVLVEAGVIVNRKEEEILEQASTKKVIAAAIAQGIEDCKVLDLLL
jgi:N-acetylmuramoyl-L-alanine amidase